MDFKKIALILLSFILLNCNKDEKKDIDSFSFNIGNPAINVSTCKSKGNFFVYFYKGKENYIEFENTDADAINIIFDENNNIYILDSDYIKRKEIKSDNIHFVNQQDYDKYFFEKRMNTKPKILKDGFQHIFIFTVTNSIYLKKGRGNNIKIK